MKSLIDEHERYRSVIEANLERFMPESDPESAVLHESMMYSLMAGGKRIRPVLLLASCELCGGEIDAALPYACALECIHTSSLIHDDHPSMDNDDLRRGKPTNHKVYGDGMAILAGDSLLNSAYDIMLEDIAADSAGDLTDVMRRVNAMKEISNAAGVMGMMAGQAVDLEAEKRSFADGDLLRYMHMHKTGALIRAAVRAGAIIGGCGREELESLTEYAENIGITFQIIDDILDVTGDSELLGKNSGVDQKLGKLTYPAVYGLELSAEKAERATEAAVSSIESFGDRSYFLRQFALDLLNRIS